MIILCFLFFLLQVVIRVITCSCALNKMTGNIYVIIIFIPDKVLFYYNSLATQVIIYKVYVRCALFNARVDSITRSLSHSQHTEHFARHAAINTAVETLFLKREYMLSKIICSYCFNSAKYAKKNEIDIVKKKVKHYWSGNFTNYVMFRWGKTIIVPKIKGPPKIKNYIVIL